jgi:hypothetical protein
MEGISGRQKNMCKVRVTKYSVTLYFQGTRSKEDESGERGISLSGKGLVWTLFWNIQLKAFEQEHVSITLKFRKTLHQCNRKKI